LLKVGGGGKVHISGAKPPNKYSRFDTLFDGPTSIRVAVGGVFGAEVNHL